MKVRWTRLAVNDLAAAADFVAQENPRAARAVLTRITRAIKTLSKHPEIGRPGRIKATRELVITGTPFILAYRIKHSEIQILAFLHARRKWPDIL